MDTGYSEIVRSFIEENFLFGNPEALAEETSFIDSRIIDSTGILELVSFLEEYFHIAIADSEIVPENLDSLKGIATFLGRKIDGNLPPPPAGGSARNR